MIQRISIWLGLSVCTAVLSPNLYSQGIYFVPSPTNVTEPVRLYVDVSSPDCQCSELTDVGPNNPMYIWTWEPSNSRADITVDGETIQINNGEWDSSNEQLRMTQDETNPSLWYFDFLGVPPTEFYGTSAAGFYSTGIKFLVKEFNGKPTPDGPEQKSADLTIIPESPGCVEEYCLFPTIWYPTDYLTITYDNNQETIPALQNLGMDEALIWYRYKVDGTFRIYQNPENAVMESLGGGFFTVTMIPNQFFGIEEGETIEEIEVYITKDILQAPPFSVESIFPGCPE